MSRCGGGQGVALRRGAENEIAMMVLSNHASIVACLESFLWRDELWIVMELLAHGSLASNAASTPVPWCLVRCLRVQAGVLRAVIPPRRGAFTATPDSDNILVGREEQSSSPTSVLRATDGGGGSASRWWGPYWMAPSSSAPSFMTRRWTSGLWAS